MKISYAASLLYIVCHIKPAFSVGLGDSVPVSAFGARKYPPPSGPNITPPAGPGVLTSLPLHEYPPPTGVLPPQPPQLPESTGWTFPAGDVHPVPVHPPTGPAVNPAPPHILPGAIGSTRPVPFPDSNALLPVYPNSDSSVTLKPAPPSLGPIVPAPIPQIPVDNSSTNSNESAVIIHDNLPAKRWGSLGHAVQREADGDVRYVRCEGNRNSGNEETGNNGRSPTSYRHGGVDVKRGENEQEAHDLLVVVAERERGPGAVSNSPATVTVDRITGRNEDTGGRDTSVPSFLTTDIHRDFNRVRLSAPYNGGVQAFRSSGNLDKLPLTYISGDAGRYEQFADVAGGLY